MSDSVPSSTAHDLSGLAPMLRDAIASNRPLTATEAKHVNRTMRTVLALVVTRDGGWAANELAAWRQLAKARK